ncbi:NAD(P)-dependent oxidoreductase [Microbacterium hominis]|uniref:NAD(P)-dependent oxidoreductase n=1 Tax=Microbacterium hominis TaxID=162426 RepID=UPI00295F00B2|nr:NAD(P)-dependent oxidoreductase [Microbacterium hominis]
MTLPLDDENVRLGVIGVGAMGAPMARRLLHARGSLSVFTRSPRPDLEAGGATLVATPRELAARSDAILVMLPDLPELEAVLDGEDGLLAGADTLLLMIGSTSSPTGVRALAERLHRTSGGAIRVVDCPVSGGADGAEDGTLSIMIGGAGDDAARAAALLAPCGRAVHLGPLGAGEVAKACNQLVVAATITALGEATELAARSGLDLDALWALLSGGYAGSNLLTSRRHRLVSGDDSPLRRRQIHGEGSRLRRRRGRGHRHPPRSAPRPARHLRRDRRGGTRRPGHLGDASAHRPSSCCADDPRGGLR